MSQPIPRYHIVPHFSIPLIEAGGQLQLGSLIASIASADDTINEDCHQPIPQSQLFCGHQTGFTATRSRMTSGEFGFFARLMGVNGVGGELSWAAERSAEDVYHFRAMDTIYFNPSQAYLEASMDQEDVRDHIAGSGDRHVLMVTGIKTARGPSVKMVKGRKLHATTELGISEPGGLPIELGPRISHSRDARREMGFEDSTDFIIAVRVKKLGFKKHWLSRSPRTLVAQSYDKGATMLDDDAMSNRIDEVIDLGDVLIGKCEREICEVDGEIVETEWVVDHTRDVLD